MFNITEQKLCDQVRATKTNESLSAVELKMIKRRVAEDELDIGGINEDDLNLEEQEKENVGKK